MFDIEKAFREIAKGDKEAYEFCEAFYGWVQTLDDLIDQDQPITAEKATVMNVGLIYTLAKNKFFAAHQETLLPIILVSSVAYIDSERFKTHEHVLDRIASQVLKSQYADVFYYVAFLRGGMGHMLAMTKQYREFSYDPVPAPSCSVSSGTPQPAADAPGGALNAPASPCQGVLGTPGQGTPAASDLAVSDS
jgi:hypothetical protein